MHEDPAILGAALAENDLTLIGGVVFRPFHDPAAWDEVWDAALRTCKALVAHGAQHLVLIDSVSPRRAPTAGRVAEAEQMSPAEWHALVNRIRRVAQLDADHGLSVDIYAHTAGFVDFEPELERLLAEVDDALLKFCFDTGHHSCAGFDPIIFMQRHMPRISYMNYKYIDQTVKTRAIARRTSFYDACGESIYCNLGQGDVDFAAVRAELLTAGFNGWCTVEQDCDPAGATSPVDDARGNRDYLSAIGF